MKNIAYAVMAMAALGACEGTGGGGPGGGGNPGTPPPVNGVPAAIAGDLDGAAFGAGDETLTVQITLDSGVVNAVYNRDAAYDIPGVGGAPSYLAFTNQDDPLDRFGTGLAAQSADGAVQAVVVADGGQFTKFFGGATFRQSSTYTAPTTGLVSYAGTYAGLINVSTRDGTLPAPGVNSDLLPERSGRVTGDVFLDASFADNSVNGAITNRQDVDELGFTLDTVFLIPTGIASDGTFGGEAQDREQSGVGSYAGIFGGNGATSVAGGLNLTGEFAGNVDNEVEFGIFVLNRCGTSGSEPTVCGIVN
jgi:hypothetical protein